MNAIAKQSVISDFGDLPPIRKRLNVDEKYRGHIALLELDTDPMGWDACVLYCHQGEDHGRAQEISKIAEKFGDRLQNATPSSGSGHYRIKPAISVSHEVLAQIYASENLGRDLNPNIQRLANIEKEKGRTGKIDRNNPEYVCKEIMDTAVAMNASDVHFCVRETSGAVLLRVHGVLRRWKRYPADILTKAAAYGYNQLSHEGSQSHAIFDSAQMQSSMIALKKIMNDDINLRWQSSYCVGGFDVVARLLKNAVDNKVKTLAELGYTPWQAERLKQASSRSHGGILIAGVTGSGKTTTLNTLSQMSPNRHLKKTIAIEDPVEYRQRMTTQISIQRKIDDDADSSGANPFVGAMRAVLRMDPDNVIFGEIRDKESGSICQAAIETGHLVMATVHASSAVGIVPRLTSKLIALERDTISSDDFLSTLIYQRLVPTNCEHCKIPMLSPASGVDPSMISLLEDVYEIDPGTVFVASEEGCDHCRIKGLPPTDNNKLGISGVTVTAEIIVPDLEFLSLIRDSKDNEAKLGWRRTRTHGFANENMEGKTAFEHAMYECSRGRIDPYYIEDSFQSIAGYHIVKI